MSRNIFYRLRYSNCKQIFGVQHVRNTQTIPDNVMEKVRKSNLNKDKVEVEETTQETAPNHFRHVYPEFLPNPTLYLRDAIREKLERNDMMKRRAVLDIPEFYVGSILAVTLADAASADKKTRFVGLCTEREGHGLRANFTLRNHINGQGVEITFEMYHPRIQRIECLKLEKRLDEHMPYLKDAAPEYSTVPFNFQPVHYPPGAPVPINPIKVKMNSYPWFSRWEIHGFKGIDYSASGVWPKRLVRAKHPQNVREWERYDLMKWYRESIDDDTANAIYSEVRAGLRRTGAAHQQRRSEALRARAQ